MPALADGRRGRPASAEARRNAVWARDADRSRPSARAVVRTALDDADETVRQAALQLGVSVWRDRDALPACSEAARGRPRARTAGPPPRRSAASATRPPCRRCSTRVAEAADRVLEHSLTFALIEIADPRRDRGRALERERPARGAPP